LVTVSTHGRIGQSYNISGENERSNLEVVTTICSLIDEIAPDSIMTPRRRLIRFVADRPGHDKRYANTNWWQSIRAGIGRGERMGSVA
jgi:dTDP-glucose 4,6-dehydratase